MSKTLSKSVSLQAKTVYTGTVKGYLYELILFILKESGVAS